MRLFHVSANESDYVRIPVYPCADSGLTSIILSMNGNAANIEMVDVIKEGTYSA